MKSFQNALAVMGTVRGNEEGDICVRPLATSIATLAGTAVVRRTLVDVSTFRAATSLRECRTRRGGVLGLVCQHPARPFGRRKAQTPVGSMHEELPHARADDTTLSHCE